MPIQSDVIANVSRPRYEICYAAARAYDALSRGISMDTLMALSEKIIRLAADLEAIARGQAPTAQDLAQAPLLLNWNTISVPSIALTGLVLDHPKLGTTPITTSLVYAMCPDFTWARTLSRYYALGLRGDAS
jgi:hypothetical protein